MLCSSGKVVALDFGWGDGWRVRDHHVGIGYLMYSVEVLLDLHGAVSVLLLIVLLILAV